MDANIYSDYDKYKYNLGESVVLWIRRVLKIKLYKTNGSAKNEQSDQNSDLIYSKLKSGERLERKAPTY
jgi:hypothetical protein